VAGAFLHYYDAFWSPWIVGEFVRKRTEWIADRAVREGCDRAELRQRLRAHVLVTDDGDFPQGERHSGLYLVRSDAFITTLSQSVPAMPANIRSYLKAH